MSLDNISVTNCHRYLKQKKRTVLLKKMYYFEYALQKIIL